MSLKLENKSLISHLWVKLDFLGNSGIISSATELYTYLLGIYGTGTYRYLIYFFL